jgi:hypothetical protein
MRISYKSLIGEHERKRTLGRPRRRLEVTVNVDLKAIEWEYVGFINLFKAGFYKQCNEY